MGFIPQLNSPGKTLNATGRDYKLNYQLECLRFALDPLVKCHAAGGFMLELEGIVHWFVPEVAVFIQDMKEVRAPRGSV